MESKIRVETMMSADKMTDLEVLIAEPIKPPMRAMIVISHGMMECVQDYMSVADKLASNGYYVVVPEVLGHGKATINGKKGFMGRGGSGFLDAIYDVKRACLAFRKNEEMPIILMGFSLGSFIVRSGLIMDAYNDLNIRGVVLVGTGNKSALELAIGKRIVSARMRKYGESNVKGVVDDLAVDNYNKKIPAGPDNSPYRWLIKDESFRKSFNPGEWHASPRLMYDLLEVMQLCREDIGLLKKIPVCLISGREDPVTGDIRKLEKFFKRKGGCSVVSLTVDGRHAILRDLCMDVAIEYILGWLNILVE